MRWIEKCRMAMLMLFQRRSEAVRLNDELQFHLEQQIKENVASGLSPVEARYAVLRAFGNPALLREQAGPAGAGTGWKRRFAISALACAR